MNDNSPVIEDLQKLPHNFQIMFAIFCAKQVVHLVQEKDKEVCLKAIEVAEAFIEGKATKEQAYAAYAAAYAAHAAAYAAVHAAAHAAYAAYAAAYAAHAAAYAAAHVAHAAYAAAHKQKLIKEQWKYYNELLNFEKNFEEMVLR